MNLSKDVQDPHKIILSRNIKDLNIQKYTMFMNKKLYYINTNSQMHLDIESIQFNQNVSRLFNES